MPEFTRPGRRRVSTATVVALSLFVAAVVPLPRESGPAFGAVGPDKLLHGGGHAALAAALAAELDGDARRAAVAAVALSTAVATATELLQRRVPGRTYERGDVVAGLVGSVAGAGVAVYGPTRASRR